MRRPWLRLIRCPDSADVGHAGKLHARLPQELVGNRRSFLQALSYDWFSVFSRVITEIGRDTRERLGMLAAPPFDDFDGFLAFGTTAISDRLPFEDQAHKLRDGPPGSIHFALAVGHAASTVKGKPVASSLSSQLNLRKNYGVPIKIRRRQNLPQMRTRRRAVRGDC